MIEAFAQYFRDKPVQLRIGGMGPRLGYLKKLAEKLKVKKQITFLGYLDRKVLIREMQAADCFVLSSLAETFGVVLIEALASGTPIIATDCGGTDEVVTEDNGILIESGDPVALGRAMMNMIETRGQYRPEYLREACKRRFGTEAFMQRANQLYTKAVAAYSKDLY